MGTNSFINLPTVGIGYTATVVASTPTELSSFTTLGPLTEGGYQDGQLSFVQSTGRLYALQAAVGDPNDSTIIATSDDPSRQWVISGGLSPDATTPGAIPFVNASGDGFVVDPDDLFFDTTTKSLHIDKAGNYNPSTPLIISGVSNFDNSSILFDLDDDQAIVKEGGGGLILSVQDGGALNLAAIDTNGSFAQIQLNPGPTGSVVIKANRNNVFTSDGNQNAIMGKPTTQPAASTQGFAYMNGGSSPPTGIPSRPFGAGTYAYYFQEPNTLWIHNGTAWRSVALA
jgi:hypothetical protein